MVWVSHALVHPAGQMPGEYRIDVAEKGKAGGKQVASPLPLSPPTLNH